MLPLERTARTESSINNRLSESQLPKPSRSPSRSPGPEARGSDRRWEVLLQDHHAGAKGADPALRIPGDHHLRIQRHHPRPHHSGPAGCAHRGAPDQQAAEHRAVQLPDLDQRAPAGRRLCPSTTATPQTSPIRGSTRTTITPTSRTRARSGTTITG